MRTQREKTSRSGDRGMSGIAALTVMAGLGIATTLAPEVAQAAPRLEPVSSAACTLSPGEQAVMQDVQGVFYEITMGARTSTTFPIDAGALLGRTDFTAYDYGIEPVLCDYAYDEATGEQYVTNYQLNPDFTNAINEDVANHMYPILCLLRAERPSLCDWYEATETSPVGMNFHAYDDGGLWHVAISDVTVSCPPNSTCSTGGYEVDPGGIARIQQALAVAEDIANRHAGEEPGQRVRSWQNEIESIATRTVTYDVYGDRAAYSDPWFFSSVFDGDPSTPSVCEGYAKALKLLFELSGHDAECHVAWGTAATNASSVLHTWNVIKVPDGRGYIADLYADEPGTNLGGKLVLVPAQGSVGGGYSVDSGNGHSVWYGYDDETLGIHPWDDLTVSETPYDNWTPPAPEPEAPVQIAEPAPEPTKPAAPVDTPPAPAEKTEQEKPTENTESVAQDDTPRHIDNTKKIVTVILPIDAGDQQNEHVSITVMSGASQLATAIAATPLATREGRVEDGLLTSRVAGTAWATRPVDKTEQTA